MKNWLILFCLFVALGIKAQTVVTVANLHDTLQPKTTYLSDVPNPTPSKEGKKPKITTFAPNIAQGQAFFTTYNSDDGLALDGISNGKSTVCDSEGNIWFATSGGGVSKYDGKSFISYTTDQGLANNYVWCIATDKSGNLWFGTYGGGVTKYDGKSFISYTTDQGLANNYVLSIAEDKIGNLWFGTYGGGVSKYDGKSFISYTTDQGLAHNTVLSIAADKSGNLWFGTDDGGVSKYDPSTTLRTGSEFFITYTTEQGLANNTVLSIAADKSGNLWFGTDGGVSKLVLSETEGSDGKSFISYTTDQGLANNSVSSIAADRSGNLWFGTDGGGVSKYNGKFFISYTTDQGLANNNVMSIAADKSGNLWFGTFGGGVSKYDGKSFISYTTDQGLTNNYVLSIAADKSGNLWFGTDGGGVSKYDGKSFISYTTEQGLANNTVISIAADKSGNLWFGTYGGVSKLVLSEAEGSEGKSFITYTTDQGLANNSVSSIAADKSGNLWFGTDGGGVSKYDGKSFTSYTTDQGLANNSVFSIVEDKNGNLWFGTSGGVSKLVLSEAEGSDGKSFISYTTDQGLANNYVLSIAADKSGNLWFGTDGGVSFLREDLQEINEKVTTTKKVFVNYTTEDGLSDNVIMGIKETNDGKIILGTNFGLSVLTRINGSKPSVEIYNQFTGYPVRDVNGGGNNNGAMCYDSKGVLWVGHGSNGVTRVDLAAVNKSNEAPNVLLNKVSLKGEDVCYYSLGTSLRRFYEGKSGTQSAFDSGIASSATLPHNNDSTLVAQQEIATYGKVLSQAERDTLNTRFAGITFDGITKFYPLPENLVLPYEHNALSFEFNTIETGRNFMVNYQYMLQGMDDTWSPITKKADATYNNLSEGNYTFLLKAESPWGVWSEPTAFKFTVLPPWFRTWWAYLGYAIIGLFFIWGLIRIQTKKLKAKQKVLEQKVEEATKEVKSEKLKVESSLIEVESQKLKVEKALVDVEAKNVEIESQKLKVEEVLVEVEKAHEALEETHKEITDSINYAERIQGSFLATKEQLDQHLKDYFVFFRPKDVVSGDFYLAGSLANGDFAVVNADSTGHGVPGAIMSILNINAIEKAVDVGLSNPAEIFNSARTTIIQRLKKDGSEHGGKDGMDASIICFNADKTKMTYTAAQNPIWIIRNGEVIKIKAEKMPIGKHDKDQIPFVGGEFDLQKGDQVYTLTDGFQDQFGGPKGKKFMITKMREYVLSIAHLPMQEQYEKLDKVFSDWKGDLEQVDDVCVIGVKI
jgi:ligand-binding sensor domain-containing protein/serine phosphatase RsbU (regulator of sigma subunit)